MERKSGTGWRRHRDAIVIVVVVAVLAWMSVSFVAAVETASL